MLAILLFLLLGPHAALAELMAELLLGVAVIGGGGGKRARRTLSRFLARLRLRSRRTATA
jgi:hypothetical protein